MSTNAEAFSPPSDPAPTTHSKVELSIIVPTFNEQEYIVGLLESLKKHLVDICIEVVVVDNGSEDDTRQLAARYEFVRLIPLDARTKPSIARNRGVKEARSEMLVFLDADVVITKEWAESMQNLRRGGTDLTGDFVTGGSYHISSQPSWIERFWFEPLRRRSNKYINGGNIILPKSTFLLIGGFNEELETGEDVEFCYRALDAGVRVVNSEHWKVIHEGFPKTISEFVKRESWHGKSDFISIKAIGHSKIAIATVVFLVLHVSLLPISLGIINNQLAPPFLGLPLCLIVFLVFLRVSIGLPVRGFTDTVVAAYIAYWYFVGRAISIGRALMDA